MQRTSSSLILFKVVNPLCYSLMSEFCASGLRSPLVAKLIVSVSPGPEPAPEAVVADEFGSMATAL